MWLLKKGSDENSVEDSLLPLFYIYFIGVTYKHALYAIMHTLEKAVCWRDVKLHKDLQLKNEVRCIDL